ncbi:MAG TPA: 50S ribosomal protein L11 methyltransferase [Nannocystaceae bacterium]|nr:50S ribosomal protein L11 methyltransferase [Nannocystaceae bacterium]
MPFALMSTARHSIRSSPMNAMTVVSRVARGCPRRSLAICIGGSPTKSDCEALVPGIRYHRVRHLEEGSDSGLPAGSRRESPPTAIAERDDRAPRIRQMTTGGSMQPWAIVTVKLEADRTSRDTWSLSLDLLEELGAQLAAVEGVGGVEVKDAELLAYTTPACIETVTTAAQRGGQALGITVVARAEVRTDDDWRDAWKQFYAPLVLGDGALLLRPSWIDRRPGDPAREVVLDPGRAFGTGLHETTRLCLDRIVSILASGPQPQRVLDLGCGSGILALCAARCFEAAQVVAVDIDPESTATSAENAALNGLDARVEIRTGDLEAVRGDRFELVLANIRADTLRARASALLDIVVPGGLLVLSGVLVDEREELEPVFLSAGFARDERIDPWPRQQGEWIALDLRRMR